MLASLRAPIFRALNARMFYGWTVLFVASLIMFGTGPGQSHLIGLFFDPIQAELGLDRTEIALAYGSATLVAALLLPRMGRLVDRFGPANMIALIAFGLGLGAIIFSFANSWLYLAIGFGAEAPHRPRPPPIEPEKLEFSCQPPIEGRLVLAALPLAAIVMRHHRLQEAVEEQAWALLIAQAALVANLAE